MAWLVEDVVLHDIASSFLFFIFVGVGVSHCARGLATNFMFCSAHNQMVYIIEAHTNQAERENQQRRRTKQKIVIIIIILKRVYHIIYILLHMYGAYTTSACDPLHIDHICMCTAAQGTHTIR